VSVAYQKRRKNQRGNRSIMIKSAQKSLRIEDIPSDFLLLSKKDDEYLRRCSLLVSHKVSELSCAHPRIQPSERYYQELFQIDSHLRELKNRKDRLNSIALDRRSALQKILRVQPSKDLLHEVMIVENQIKDAEANRQKVFNMLFYLVEDYGKIVEMYRNDISGLENEIKRLEIISELIQKAISDKLVRQKMKITREKSRAEKLALEKAHAAAYRGETRELANVIKRKLNQEFKNHDFCPYCFNPIGDSPHADHIYPVSRGGLSTIENMIYVCKDCNSKKSDFTLLEFIKASNLNRDRIEVVLEKMGKRF
jgi:5-methylcytosine-specific restriction endonuclease McrA